MSYALDKLNETLMDQLDRLMSVDRNDKEAFAAEVERSRAVSGVANQVVSVGNLGVKATELAMQLKGPKYVRPPMLVEECCDDGQD